MDKAGGHIRLDKLEGGCPPRRALKKSPRGARERGQECPRHRNSMICIADGGADTHRGGSARFLNRPPWSRKDGAEVMDRNAIAVWQPVS